MLSKKGVSPLIATVLLLAFAVALATVIIQLEPFGSCTVSTVIISKDAEGLQKVCFNNETNKIELTVSNNDERTIMGFRINAEGQTTSLDIDHLSAKIGNNDEGKIDFGYDVDTFGQLRKINIFPKMNNSNKLQECGIQEDITAIQFCK